VEAKMLDFPIKEKIQNMDRLAIIQRKKLLRQRLDFPNNEDIEIIDGLAVIQGLKYVEKTVRFSK